MVKGEKQNKKHNKKQQDFFNTCKALSSVPLLG